MFIGLLAAGLLVYVVFSGFPNRNFSDSVHKNPEDILRERFARGEIDEKQYQQMKDTLRR
ncbi:MAG: hypothetical protein PWQ12_1325 [Clostridiales bacterium]|jgi:putative membrane protein|nr:hypothetical protein [Clostridiales bacterium]